MNLNRGGGYPECMQTLIESLSKMPGIGIRTAERLAYYILSADPRDVQTLADSIKETKQLIRYCKHCFNLSQGELCSICLDPGRASDVLCVVEEPKDIITLEKSGAFRGLYHVLMGSLSPLDGVGPNDIKIPELLGRVRREKVTEIILALTSDTEGEATSLYLINALKAQKIKITRLAQGIPMGSELEFADRATLMRAIEARTEIKT